MGYFLYPVTMGYFVPSDHGLLCTQRPWVVLYPVTMGYFCIQQLWVIFDPEHVIFIPIDHEYLLSVTMDAFYQTQTMAAFLLNKGLHTPNYHDLLIH